MYTRRYRPREEVIHYWQRFDKIYFLTEGKLDLHTHMNKVKFLELKPNSVFGDYGLLFNLRSNVTWKTPDIKMDQSYLELAEGWAKDSEATLTNFMCVDGDIFNNLCELYPNTAQIVRDIAIEKRDIIQYFYKQALRIWDIDVSGVPRGLCNSRRLSGNITNEQPCTSLQEFETPL